MLDRKNCVYSFLLLCLNLTLNPSPNSHILRPTDIVTISFTTASAAVMTHVLLKGVQTRPVITSMLGISDSHIHNTTHNEFRKPLLYGRNISYQQFSHSS